MAESNQLAESTKIQLKPYAVTDVVFTGVELGRGSYGSVHEARVAGALCAAKQIHEEFFVVGSLEEVEVVLKVFVAECTLLSNLRHPNVVQFFGICYLKDKRFPILLMEKLQGCLHSMLESKSNLSLVAKHSILLNVSRGIAYLHSRDPSVIHRDLSARNILLTPDMVPKIADLGMARFLELKKGSHVKTMTNAPGNIIYMPPEALEPGCKYNTSIDVFSFGNLALFTLTRVFPELLAATYTHPKKDKVLGRSEVERRQKYFAMLNDTLGAKHGLIKLVTACLQNKTKSRPTAPEIVKKLEEIKIDEEDRFWSMSKPELMEYISYREKEMERIADMLGKQQDVITSQKEKIETTQEKLETAEATKQHLKASALSRSTSLDVVNRRMSLDLATRPAVSLDHHTEATERVRFEIKGFEMSPLDPPSQATPNLSTSLESLMLPSLAEAAAGTEGDIKFPCSISWETADQLPDMGSPFTNDAVTIGDHVYIRSFNNEIVKYTPHLNHLEQLPCPLAPFKMVEIQEQLAIIRDEFFGIFNTKNPNNILVWNETSHCWTEPYPSPPYKLAKFGAVYYHPYLLLIANHSKHPANHSTNILDTTTREWHTFNGIPKLFSVGHKLNRIGDTLITSAYSPLVNGMIPSSKKVFIASIPDLIEQATSGSTQAKQIAIKRLADRPHLYMTLLTVGQHLMAFDGASGFKNKRNAYMYNPSLGNWVLMSKYSSFVPSALFACSYVVLPSNKILVCQLKNTFIGTMTLQ